VHGDRSLENEILEQFNRNTDDPLILCRICGRFGLKPRDTVRLRMETSHHTPRRRDHPEDANRLSAAHPYLPSRKMERAFGGSFVPWYRAWYHEEYRENVCETQ
jgi:hypothetical protein